MTNNNHPEAAKSPDADNRADKQKAAIATNKELSNDSNPETLTKPNSGTAAKGSDSEFEAAFNLIKKIQNNINKALIGQQEVVEQALTCLFAGGHLLIEGVPGLGKTLLVRSIAKSFAGQFSRIQFTPDLMPSDVTGHAMYDPKSEKFRIRKGPAFTNLLLADEINRAPAKTQAALLEVMQEKNITIEGKSHPVSTPFMVLATQNPLDQEGTYPLPEAELDRFLMNILIRYPSHKDEVSLVRLITTGQLDDSILTQELSAVTTPEQIIELQKLASSIRVDNSLFDYVVRIVSATREWSGIQMGASPRASIAMIRAARALALIRGNPFVTPDEIKEVTLPIMRHRLVLSAELEIEGISVEQIIDDILTQVAAPRS